MGIESAVRHGILVEKCCYHLPACLRYAILKKHLSHLVPDGTKTWVYRCLYQHLVPNGTVLFTIFHYLSLITNQLFMLFCVLCVFFANIAVKYFQPQRTQRFSFGFSSRKVRKGFSSRCLIVHSPLLILNF